MEESSCDLDMCFGFTGGKDALWERARGKVLSLYGC